MLDTPTGLGHPVPTELGPNLALPNQVVPQPEPNCTLLGEMAAKSALFLRHDGYDMEFEETHEGNMPNESNVTEKTLHNSMLLYTPVFNSIQLPGTSVQPSETFMNEQATHEQTIVSNVQRSMSVGNMSQLFQDECEKKKNAERVKQYRETKKQQHELLQQEVLYLRTENKRLTFLLQEVEKKAQKGQSVKQYMTSAAYRTISSIGTLVQLINDNLHNFNKEIFENLGVDTEEQLLQIVSQNTRAANLAVSQPSSAKASDDSGDLGHGLREHGFMSCGLDDIFSNTEEFI